MKQHLTFGRSLRTAKPVIWRSLAILFFFVFVTYEAGCEYTISGNPDVNLIEVRLSPEKLLMSAGGSVDLTATLAGAMNDHSISWSIVGDSASHLVTNGFTAKYTAPDSVAGDQLSVTIMVHSNEDQSKSASCVITVINSGFSSGDVSLNPVTVSMLTSNPLQFEARTVGGSGVVRWAVVSGPGSISYTGLYIPPDTAADNTRVTIEARSTTDTTRFAQSYITLTNATDSLKCFSRDIQPMLTANCGISGCHGGNGGSNINLTNYEGVLREVQPGDARGSRLYQAVTQLNQNSRMPPPPHPALAPNQILALGKWIDEGARNTTCK